MASASAPADSGELGVAFHPASTAETTVAPQSLAESSPSPSEPPSVGSSAIDQPVAPSLAQPPTNVAAPSGEVRRPLGETASPLGEKTLPLRDTFPLPDTAPLTHTVPLGEMPAPLGETPAASGEIPVPSPRQPLSKDLEEEFAQAMAGQSLEALIAGSTTPLQRGTLELQSQYTGRVVAVGKEEVFLELGGREQGSVPLRLFEQPPEVGSMLDVVVERFNVEDGLYELSLPQKPVEVDDWGDLRAGMLVEARITGHNAGGLECRVNNLRAFIPVSQVALYRVENLQEFVGQTLECVVTEADRQRRNLVLSRRAVLEREREQARQELLASLEPGQVREGVVRKLTDFGAFVDLGAGVDGLVHISQLAWHRVQHPSEVLSEGQRIQVRIEKVDPETKKISLAYRDLQQNPWSQVLAKYPPQSVVRGKVTKLMEYGAFVELEPGIEGLVHISELSPKRVWRVSDVVKEGDAVEVLVLSVDPQAQRISLSIKALSPLSQPKKEQQDEQSHDSSDAGQPTEPASQTAPPQPRKPRKPKPEKPLLGGLDRPAKGQRFGLRW